MGNSILLVNMSIFFKYSLAAFAYDYLFQLHY